MRQNKFTWAVLLSSDEGLGTQCETALRSFGLRKLTLSSEVKDLQNLLKQREFDLVLIDTEFLKDQERENILENLSAHQRQKKSIVVALSRIESPEELLDARQQGFDSVLIKPISIVMMEQAFSEIIERLRTDPIERSDLKQLYESFLRGNTFEALRTLHIWLEKEDESIEGSTLLSLLYLKRQEFFKANQTIQKVFRIDPNFLPALQLKTRISLRLGQLNEAFRALDREEKVVALRNAKRGEILVHSNSKSHLKERSFCNDFGTRDGITTLLINLGLQLSKTGKSDDSLKLYHRALGPLEDENSRFIVFFNRARLYLNIRRNSEAREDLLRAKELAPSELYPRIDELLILSRVTKQGSAPASLKGRQSGTFNGLVPDFLDQKPLPQKEKQYKKFNQEEALKLVFLGKMEVSTIPPESFHEWIQMKEKLLHVLFLSDLPLTNSSNIQSASLLE